MKINRFILTIGILLFSVLFTIAAEKKVKTDTAESNKLVKLIESKVFYIVVDDAFPTGNSSISISSKYGEKTIGGEGHVSLATNQGEIFFLDTVATGKLPFFGRAYSVPYGEGGGIEFDKAQINQESLNVVKKRKKQYVEYRFTVRNRNDVFTIYVEAYSNGRCNVKVNSNNRASISYDGKISAIPEEKMKYLQ